MDEQDKHDESKLPKWAQQRLAWLRTDLACQDQTIKHLREAHELVGTRNWFTIARPPFASHRPDQWVKLWYFAENEPVPICSLGPRDALLVGRDAGPEEDAP
jgi:hypothetical protein